MNQILKVAAGDVSVVLYRNSLWVVQSKSALLIIFSVIQCLVF